MITLTQKIAAAFVAALLVTIAWQAYRLRDWQHVAGANALRADSIAAVNDTTRVIALTSAERQAAHLGDSIVIVARAAEQSVSVLNDALDHALKANKIVGDSLRLAVAQLHARAVAEVTNSAPSEASASLAGQNDTLKAVFNVRQPPYTARAAVWLPRRGNGELSLDVSVDSAALSLRIDCSASPNAGGIKSAQAVVSAPAWLSVKLARVEQSADLCRSPALEPAHGDDRSLVRRLVDRLGVSAGYGITASGGKAYAGTSALAGVRVWP